jgi:hypothetical protein
VRSKTLAIVARVVYVARVPQQNPLTRIEQVALDLKQLADEIEEYLGPEAKTALLYWHSELLAAINEIQRDSPNA